MYAARCAEMAVAAGPKLYDGEVRRFFARRQIIGPVSRAHRQEGRRRHGVSVMLKAADAAEIEQP